MPSTSLMTLAQVYAAAKSAQDVAGALAVCADDFVLDAPAFGTRSHGKAETAAQLNMFFAAFPDYGVTLEGSLAGDDTVACWGTATMTLAGPFLDIAPTGRTARIPFVSVFTARDGRLTGERFYFDLAALATQLGLSTDRMLVTLAALRDATAGAEAHA
jgi:steroid delta-isomerase-like uncharacterized protein